MLQRRCSIDNNLYVQIGLVLLIALSAKNAILIVEVARELRAEGKAIVESAIEAARARFRPILMTSFAFILGVAPLVLATGAGASARKSIGITVFTGMIASTCLAVLFVPSFFVIVQRFEEWPQGAQEQAGRARAGGMTGRDITSGAAMSRSEFGPRSADQSQFGRRKFYASELAKSMTDIVGSWHASHLARPGHRRSPHSR